MALICIRVHSPLFFCHFSTMIFHMRCSVADHFVTFQVFSHEISSSESLSLLNCDLFTLSVQILVMAPKIVSGMVTGFATVNIYCLRCIVDFCSTSYFYNYIFCVDRSGSLSSGAFNQLRLVTLNIVLTILY